MHECRPFLYWVVVPILFLNTATSALGGELTPVSGRVYDKDKGTGIAGVTVAAIRFVDDNPGEVTSQGFDPGLPGDDEIELAKINPVALTQTAAEGSFSLELPDGMFEIIRTKIPGYPPMRTLERITVFTRGIATQGVDFPLTQGLSIDGCVTEEDGTPIENASLMLNVTGMGRYHAITDVEGCYTFYGLQSVERPSIQAIAYGYHPACIQLPIPPYACIGRYSIAGVNAVLEPGTWIEPPLFSPFVQIKDLPEDIRKAVEERETRMRRTEVAGKVVTVRGEPIFGATIYQLTGGACMNRIDLATTDEAGTFRFEYSDDRTDEFDDKLWFRADHPAYAYAQDADFTIWSKDIKYVLNDKPEVSGQVIDGVTGKPLTHFTVSFCEYNSPWHMRQDAQTTHLNVADPEGRFNFFWASDFPASLDVRAVGYATHVIPVKLEFSSKHDEFKIALQPEKVLHGRVLDASGHPAADALVELITDSPCLTDANGKFTYTGLGPYVYDVRIRHTSKKDFELRGFDLSDEKNWQKEFALTDEMEAEGKTILFGKAIVDGQPLANHEVLLRWKDGAESSYWSVRTNDNGEYRYFGMPSGDFNVRLNLNENGKIRTVQYDVTLSYQKDVEQDFIVAN